MSDTGFAPNIVGGIPFAYPSSNDCLFYDDEPLLYLARDGDGCDWLIEITDSDTKARTTTSMAFALSAEEADSWRVSGVDLIAKLHEVCVGMRERWLIVGSWDGRLVSLRAPTADEVADAAPRD